MTQIDRINGLTEGVAFKVPCRAATTANITLSGEQTIDGVAVVSGDRVLVKDQTTGSENGIYDASTSAWTRAKDWNGSRDVKQGTQVYVNDGTGFGTYKLDTADDITIGTTSVSFSFLDAVTASNVAAAGAMMDSDISEDEGLLRKTGAGVYEALKTNLSASAAPTVNDDTSLGYAVGSRWIDLTGDKEYVCVDNTDGAAVWKDTVNDGAADNDAIHDNVANEISAITEKTTPVSADLLIIEDSAASGVKKKLQIGNLPADADAIHDNVDGEIAALTEKTTPVSADLVVIEDSAASNAKKKVQIGNLGVSSQWELLSSASITAVTNLDITFDETTYNAIRVEIEDALPNTDNVDMRIRMLYNNGASVESASGYYDYKGMSVAAYWTATYDIDDTATQGVGSAAGEGINGSFELAAFATAIGHGVLASKVAYKNIAGTGFSQSHEHFFSGATSRVIDGLRFYWESGTFQANGTIKVYGLKRA